MPQVEVNQKRNNHQLVLKKCIQTYTLQENKNKSNNRYKF